MPAILFSEMTPQAEWETRFNAWYDEEHIPLRMAVPGFTGARRYRRNDRDYLAVYEMESASVLSSDAYAKVKNQPSETTAWMLRSVSGFSRYIGDEIGLLAKPGVQLIDAPVLYPVFFQVPRERLPEFDAWYDEDHVPTLLESEDWWGCRRFALQDAHPHAFNRLALHYIEDARALDSEARKKARSSAWREKLAAEDWFRGTYMVFYRHGAPFGAIRQRVTRS